MSANLDKSWVYTTKVNISEIEKIGRNNAYRQGIEDFKQALSKEILALDSFDPQAEILGIINTLKK